MSERNVHDPQDNGSELPVEGAVDRLGGTGSTPGSRPGSRHLFPFLTHGIELATGLFNRLQTVFVGLDPDGFRVGNLVVSLTSGVMNILSNIWSEEAEENANLEITNSHLSAISGKETSKLVQGLAESGTRKIANIDAGAITVAATGVTATFTGVNLVNRAAVAIDPRTGERIQITNIVDPAGGAVGTLTLAKAVAAATFLVVPYQATPHAWNSATDAQQTSRVEPEWSHYNGPTQEINVGPAVIGNGTAQYVLPCVNYGYFHIQLCWTNAGTSTQDVRVYGKQDNLAWPVPIGLTPDYRDIGSRIQLTTGSSSFNTMLSAGCIEGWTIVSNLFNSILIEVTTGNTGGNTAMSGWYGLAGRGH